MKKNVIKKLSGFFDELENEIEEWQRVHEKETQNYDKKPNKWRDTDAGMMVLDDLRSIMIMIEGLETARDAIGNIDTSEERGMS